MGSVVLTKDQKVFSYAEAARYLTIAHDTFRDVFVARALVTPARRSGRNMWFTRSELDRFKRTDDYLTYKAHPKLYLSDPTGNNAEVPTPSVVTDVLPGPVQRALAVLIADVVTERVKEMLDEMFGVGE